MKFLQQKGHLEGHFNSMSLYCILEKKSNSLDVNIAKIGFSKLAFVLSFIWGFSNGIFPYALISFLFFIISLCLTFLGVLGFEAFVIMMLLNSFYWGIFGNVIFSESFKCKFRCELPRFRFDLFHGVLDCIKQFFR